MLSNTSKYALRAVIYLAINAREGEKIGIKKISSDLDVPTPFLGKILQTLAKHRLLASTKGPNGGFGLGMSADEIHLMDVVEIVDGQDSFHKCAIGVKYCSEQKNPCALHSRYAKLRDEMKELFQSETIEQAAKEVKNKNKKIII
ncbi:MAG: RrF2 family transcriptional regulator [Bacteroidales bacterium]